MGNKEKRDKPGRPATGNVYITPRVKPETAEWLRKDAIQKGMTQGEVLEFHLADQINKEVQHG